MNPQSLTTKYGDKVRNLLEKTGVTVMPIDLDRIAEYLGLKIDPRPLEDEYSGFLVVKDKTVVVNSLHPHTRRRFTIAHEIGHFLLHSKKADVPVFIDQKQFYFRQAATGVPVNRRQEREADEFAAELLMPQQFVTDYIKEHQEYLPNGDTNNNGIKALADEFDVSRQAMAFRLCELGFESPT